MKKHLITMPKRILAVLAVLLLGLVTVSPAYADTHTGETTTTPTFTFAALPLPTPTYGTGELAIQRTSAPDATSYRFTATIMGNGVFVGTNNSRTSVLTTDPLHGGASTQYVICVPETVMINVADSTGAVVASLPAGANQAGSKDLRSCPESPPGPVDTDKDGVTDDKDGCPNVAGPASNNGCPLPVDTDGDGVTDDQDKCPNVAGPASNGGCPVPVDTDGDGVTDDKDQCVDVAGPASNNGCPVVVDEPVCAPLDSGKIDTTGDPLTVVLDAPDGMVITGYCVKAGSANQGGGPEYPALTPDQLNQNTLTVGHSSKKAVSHYSFSWGPAPTVDACPEMDGHQPPGTDCKPETPATCPPGMGWKDANDNGKIDEGECVKRTTPGAGPPAVVNPPAAPTPVAAPHTATPPADESPVDVVVPDQSVAIVSEVDATNGRGVTAETAAVGTSTSESAVISSEGRLGFGLVGLAILLTVAVWWLRPSTFE